MQKYLAHSKKLRNGLLKLKKHFVARCAHFGMGKIAKLCAQRHENHNFDTVKCLQFKMCCLMFLLIGNVQVVRFSETIHTLGIDLEKVDTNQLVSCHETCVKKQKNLAFRAANLSADIARVLFRLDNDEKFEVSAIVFSIFIAQRGIQVDV